MTARSFPIGRQRHPRVVHLAEECRLDPVAVRHRGLMPVEQRLKLREKPLYRIGDGVEESRLR